MGIRSILMIVLLLLIEVSAIGFGARPARTESATIVVPDDFPTIQEAINNAVDGDTVFVKTGTYYEHVVVNKTLSLVGENSSTTTIDGNWTGIVINVTQNCVNISDLTVQRSGSVYWENAGIFLSNVENCSIRESILTQNSFAGLELNHSRRCNISENNILSNGGVGITLVGGSYNDLSRNSFVGNSWSALTLNDEANDNTISENNMTSNNLAVTGHCINVYRSSNNSIQKNKITGDDNGIRLEYWSIFNIISRNNITDNTQAGISVERYSTYNTILQNIVSHNGYGFRIEYSSQNSIWGNNIIDNDQQTYVSPGYVNTWDDGYPAGGNYWSNYISPDLFNGPYQNVTGGDGIGDNPYIIGANNKDNYPFMLLSMCNVSQIPAGEIISPEEQVRINVAITHLHEVESVTLNYTIANDAGTFHFSLNMTSAEGDVWTATLPAFQTGTIVTYIIIGQDSEGNTINSQQQGYVLEYEVIPEFAPIIALALLAITTLLMAIMSERKTGKNPKAERRA